MKWRRVCSDHFATSQFKNPNDRKSGLLPNSIPWLIDCPDPPKSGDVRRKQPHDRGRSAPVEGRDSSSMNEVKKELGNGCDGSMKIEEIYIKEELIEPEQEPSNTEDRRGEKRRAHSRSRSPDSKKQRPEVEEARVEDKPEYDRSKVLLDCYAGDFELEPDHDEQYEEEEEDPDAPDPDSARENEPSLELEPGQVKEELGNEYDSFMYSEEIDIKEELIEPKQEPSHTEDIQGEKRRAHSRSCSPDSKKQRPEVEEVRVEDEPEYDKSAVLLDWYNRDLSLIIDKETFLSAKPMTSDGSAYVWHGVRARYGFLHGHLFYEVKVEDHLAVPHLEGEQHPYGLRCGWSIGDAEMTLGEEPFSYGYGGTAEASTNLKFKDYGQPLKKGDVIGCFLDMDSRPITMSFSVNGRNFGKCYEVFHRSLRGKALFPHILTKNCAFKVNFGSEYPWFQPMARYTFVGQIPLEERVLGSQEPQTRQDSEIPRKHRAPSKATGKEPKRQKKATTLQEKVAQQDSECIHVFPVARKKRKSTLIKERFQRMRALRGLRKERPEQMGNISVGEMPGASGTSTIQEVPDLGDQELLKEYGKSKTTTLQLREDLLSKIIPDFTDEEPTLPGYSSAVLSLDRIKNLFDYAAPICDVRKCQRKLSLQVTEVGGDVGFDVMCKHCNKVTYSDHPKQLEPFITKTNCCQVFSSIEQGSGYTGYVSNVTHSGINPLTKHRYYCIVDYIHQKVDQHMKDMSAYTGECVRDYYASMGVSPDSEGVLDVDVSYDGMWMRRGQNSHVHIGIVMECETGFVLDFETLSNYCVSCQRAEEDLSKHLITEEEFTQKIIEHAHKCDKNFSGTSEAMEKEAAQRLWARSVKNNKMRYVTFVGDGDSSAFEGIKSMNNGNGPYNIPVTKQECIDHLSKRLVRRLKNLKKELSIDVWKSEKRPQRSLLAGKGELTDAIILTLQNYYAAAIRRNIGKSVCSVKHDIIATFFHCRSTDKNPAHQLCPKGKDSWCFYNKALAKNEKPPLHSDMLVHFCLDSPQEISAVYKVYTDLSKEELLGKCLTGRIQNPNESLHSKIGSVLDKNKVYGIKTSNLSVKIVTMNHNFGYSLGSVLSKLGFGDVPGQNNLLQREKDRKRHSKQKEKKTKKSLR
ncbi:uncharacterized protein [Macrobrachium rosenbergii]